MAKKQALVLVECLLDGTLHVKPGQVVEAEERLLKIGVADGSLDVSPGAVAHAIGAGQKPIAHQAAEAPG